MALTPPKSRGWITSKKNWQNKNGFTPSSKKTKWDTDEENPIYNIKYP